MDERSFNFLKDEFYSKDHHLQMNFEALDKAIVDIRNSDSEIGDLNRKHCKYKTQSKFYFGEAQRLAPESRVKNSPMLMTTFSTSTRQAGGSPARAMY